nr:cell division topological specificity factor MinE [Chloroflexota bacterium]
MNIFSRLFGRSKTSKAIAKERLRLVLIHDRSGIPPELLNVIKNEIITVISKHVRVDREGIQIRLSHAQGLTKLEADIPIVSYRQSPTRSTKQSTRKTEASR